MLQGMEQWSQGQITEEDVSLSLHPLTFRRRARLLIKLQVSDIYVKLGNGFEQCVDAFRKAGLSTQYAILNPPV